VAWKVYKKGKRYAIINAGYGEYFLVDVMTGKAVSCYWGSAGDARIDLESLETGQAELGSFSWSVYFGYDVTDRWPKSLTLMRNKLNRPAGGGGSGKSRALSGRDLVGARVTNDQGTFATLRMPDGTYAYRLGSGSAVGGFRSASGATLSAKRAVAKRSAERLAELGVDPGEDAAQTLMEHYRERVRGVYSAAASDMRSKYSDMLDRYERNRLQWVERVRSGEATQDQFDEWLRRRAWEQDRHSEMCGQMARVLADADAEAVRMINGYTPEAYAENFNYATYQVESGAGVSTSFTLYDRDTVLRLMERDRQLIPERDTDDPKDVAWNRKKLTEAVTQGVLQGESADKVAKRLEDVMGMDKRAALRNARTALTAARNAGRCDAYARAKSMGIELRQEWQATYDARVRHSHAMMDGEQVEVGEEFSNGLRYPGDPKGPPREVFNCRCTLVPVLGGLDDGGAWHADITVNGMTYAEWKDYHTQRAPKTERQLRVMVADLEAEVEGLAKDVREAKAALDSTRREERYRKKVAEAEAKVRENEWAKDYDLFEMLAEQNRLNDRVDELAGHISGADLNEIDRIYEEIDAIDVRIDELVRRIDAKREYDSAVWDVGYWTDMLHDIKKERDTAEADLAVLTPKLDGAVVRRNRAYGELSAMLPFMPEVRSVVGDKWVDDMEAILDEAEARHPEIAAAYRRFSSQLVIKEHESLGGAYYRPSERGVYLNADEVARGDSIDTPYEVAFHEFGHMIDNVSAYGTADTSVISSLTDVIRSDWAAYRESFMDWDRVGQGFQTDEERDREVVRILKFKMDDMNSYDRGSGTLAYANLSDIIEGCTGIDYPLGSGHGAAYHRNLFNPGISGCEFIAEVFDSAMANEESYLTIKNVFPNAVELVVNIARRMCS